jgi:hypothetical protein
MPRPKVLPLEEAAAKLAEAEGLLERWTATAADQDREVQVLAESYFPSDQKALLRFRSTP